MSAQTYSSRLILLHFAATAMYTPEGVTRTLLTYTGLIDCRIGRSGYCKAYHIQYSYRCCRYQASRDDLSVWSAIDKAPSSSEFSHVTRWYNHIEALLKKE